MTGHPRLLELFVPDSATRWFVGSVLCDAERCSTRWAVESKRSGAGIEMSVADPAFAVL